MSSEQRAEVDQLLDQLEAIGSTQQPRPLDNPLLFGNYNVAYTSTARAPTERGQRGFIWHQQQQVSCAPSFEVVVQHIIGAQWRHNDSSADCNGLFKVQEI